MERDLSCTAELADLLDGLNGADLVVCKHDGHECGILADGSLKILKADNAVLVDIEQSDLKALFLELLERVQDCMMLKLCGYKVFLALECTDLSHGDYRLVICLGAAGGEVYLLGLSADYVGNGFSRGVKPFLCILRKGVQARGVAVLGGEVGHHCVKRGLADTGSCCIICVNKHIYLPFAFVYPIKSVGIVAPHDGLVKRLSPFFAREQVLERYGVEIGVRYIVKLFPHWHRQAATGAVALYLALFYAGDRCEVILHAPQYLTHGVFLWELYELIAALFAAGARNELRLFEVADYHLEILH